MWNCGLSHLVCWTVAAVLYQASSARADCGESLFVSAASSVKRDAFLLTEGESLRLSCGICGECISANTLACTDIKNQLWMSVQDREKATIRSETKTRSLPTEDPKNNEKKGFSKAVAKLHHFGKQMIIHAFNLHQRVTKVRRTGTMYMSMAVQRFDRLRRLGMESENGVGIFKEVWGPSENDADMQWFVETSNGQVTKVQNQVSGRILIFDVLVISRATVGSTGLYTCQWRGKLKARFAVTVVEGGVEPYREFEPSTGRSLQSKLMPKANLEVYTRWLDHSRSLLIKMPNATEVRGMVEAYNLSITWGICYVKQMDADRPVLPEGSPLLKLVPHGLPCRSHLLPVSVRSLRSVVKRPSETRKTRTVVLVKASEFSYGLKETQHSTKSPPPLSVEASLIKRTFMIANKGEFVSLQSPLSRTLRTLIAWFQLPNITKRVEINSSEIVDGIMDPFSLRESTDGRIFTDPGGNLNIANANKSSDERKYYCLHKGRIVGYVYLIVRDAESESRVMYATSVIMSVLRVASPLVITASIIFLTLVSASSMFEPEVPW